MTPATSPVADLGGMNYQPGIDGINCILLQVLDALAQVAPVHRSSDAADCRWSAPGRAFTTWALPEFDMHMAIVRAGAARS